MKKGVVRTESTYIANSAELEAYKECGVKRFKFLATLDLRTSDICAAMDGKIIKLEDAVPGVNVPPLHPWCRSTTVPVIDEAAEAKLKRRAKDPETGEYYEIPDDMTYNQWRKHIDKSAKSGIMNIRGVKPMPSGAYYGALNPESDKDFERCEQHAKKYYEEIRNRNSDVDVIAKNTGYDVEKIRIIKGHIFINKYDLGEEEPTTFYPNYDIAVSWQNLILGKNIEQKDYILLEHEYYEYKLMHENGLKYVDAHEKAQEIYDYQKAVKEWRKQK